MSRWVPWLAVKNRHLVVVVEVLGRSGAGPLFSPARGARGRVAAEVGAPGEAAVALLVRPPVGGHANGADEPEDQVGQVDPDGVLHGLDVAVALGVLVDVHLAKDAKDGAPQDEHDEAPGRDRGEAHDERDQVEQRGQRGEGADNDGVDLKAADEHLSTLSHVGTRRGERSNIPISRRRRRGPCVPYRGICHRDR